MYTRWNKSSALWKAQSETKFITLRCSNNCFWLFYECCCVIQGTKAISMRITWNSYQRSVGCSKFINYGRYMSRQFALMWRYTQFFSRFVDKWMLYSATNRNRFFFCYFRLFLVRVFFIFLCFYCICFLSRVEFL